MADGWHIEAVGASQRLDTGGRLIDVMEAEIVLDNGEGSTTVWVPKTGDWQAALQAKIEQDAAALLAILSL